MRDSDCTVFRHGRDSECGTRHIRRVRLWVARHEDVYGSGGPQTGVGRDYTRVRLRDCRLTHGTTPTSGDYTTYHARGTTYDVSCRSSSSHTIITRYKTKDMIKYYGTSCAAWDRVLRRAAGPVVFNHVISLVPWPRSWSPRVDVFLQVLLRSSQLVEDLAARVFPSPKFVLHPRSPGTRLLRTRLNTTGPPPTILSSPGTRLRT